jgi:predicted metalloprotease
VWARNADRTRHILEEGDLEEALGAAAAIGDDRLQRQAQGRVARGVWGALSGPPS